MHMCVCYLDTWSWIVLLPSDTHRKPITSICDLFTDSPCII
jgi:hypothetical protein